MKFRSIPASKADPEKPSYALEEGEYLFVSREDAGDGVFAFYGYPPGCGLVVLTVGKGFKPDAGVTAWEWNGDEDRPTLHPSLSVGKDEQGNEIWHGHLVDGQWKGVG